MRRQTDRWTDAHTVDCEGADSIRYGEAMGAAADSFISRKLLMDIIFSTRRLWLLVHCVQRGRVAVVLYRTQVLLAAHVTG